MKRAKALVMAATAVVSAAVLGATALAAATNVSGYEALKQSGFAVIEQSGNSTASINAELFADGEKVFTMNQFAQVNKEQGASYTRYETSIAGSDSSWYEMYRDGDQNYWVSSAAPDMYSASAYSYRPEGGNENQIILTENQKKLISILLDLFTGDVKNYFVTDGNTISISLNSNQIPELMQSFIAVGAEMAVERRSDYYDNTLDGIITQYLYNPVIDSYSLVAELSDDGYPADIDMRVNLSGRDENGGLHYATLIFKIVLSDIGSTTVNSFDPQGKTESSSGFFNGLFSSGAMRNSVKISGADYDVILEHLDAADFELDGNIAFEIFAETSE